MSSRESRRHRRRMALTAAGLYAAVGVDGLSDLVIPHSHGLAVAPVVGLAVLALIMACLGPLMSERALAANGVIGVLGATYASATTSAALSDPAFLFTLPVIWQALFFGRRGALGVLGLAAVGEAVAVALNGQSGPIEHWIGVMVVVSAITGVVVALCDRNDRLLRAATRQAQIDPLTGLLNRRAFYERAEFEIAALRRSGTPYAVIVMDLDHFKAVNDEFGHEAGDRVLIRVADILGQELAGRGLLARFGGEEFVSLLPGAGADEAAALAERLRARIKNGTSGHPGEPSGLPEILISAGVAEAGPDQSLNDVYVGADEALYVAKRGGRVQVRIADPPEGPPDDSPAAAVLVP